MLRRTRVGVVLGAVILLAFLGVDAIRLDPAQFPRAAIFRLIGTALLLGLYPVTRLAGAARWSEWLGGAALVILVATTASIMPLLRGAADPSYAVQGTGIVLCILGASLLLPFDATKTSVLGVIAMALHVAFTFDFTVAQNVPVLAATLCSVVIATVGAGELTRSRRADFEGRRAKEELLRVRSDFVAMLTHDIKNPLGVIDGFVEMLRADPEMSPEARDELLANVQRAVRTAIGLAVDVLDSSKIDAGRFVLNTRPVAMADVVGRSIANHRANAAQKCIALLDESEVGLPFVEADAGALDRLFGNLLDNAIKHTPVGGTVCIGARRDGPQRIEVLVEDSGGGIAAGQESRIFERYTGAASRADSTGLGLFIARTITTAHGGTITAENRREGGARFRVVLPVGASSLPSA